VLVCTHSVVDRCLDVHLYVHVSSNRMPSLQ
jgi:hypothetical protein